MLHRYFSPGTGAGGPGNPGFWARIPGLMGTGMRDGIKKRPFSLKIARKTKYNNRHK